MNTEQPVFGVRITQLDSHAHCVLFVNHARAGRIILRREELPTLLYRLGVFQAGEILTDTDPELRKAVRDIFEGYDDAVPYEMYDFGGWRPLR